MNENVTRIIEGTFTVLILAWILTHSSEFSQITSAVGGQYVAAVNTLMPKVNRS